MVLVNTCGFVEKAKQDSIETLLAASDTGAKVVATGCMAERYGRELADSLPEAAAVLGFDHYPDMGARLDAILDGRTIESHTPRDRRELLPLTPVQRHAAGVSVPGHAQMTVDDATPAHLRAVLRQRLTKGPVAALKLASGCDRRCAFCAIPSFRGAFVSRSPTTCSPRPPGWPATECGSWCWSAKTRRPTARISATLGCWRSCCRSLPRSTASSGSGCPTCSRPRPGRAWSRRSPRRPASLPISISRSSTRPSRCCAGCAASAPPNASSTCSRRLARSRRSSAPAATSSSGSRARAAPTTWSLSVS